MDKQFTGYSNMNSGALGGGCGSAPVDPCYYGGEQAQCATAPRDPSDIRQQLHKIIAEHENGFVAAQQAREMLDIFQRNPDLERVAGLLAALRIR